MNRKAFLVVSSVIWFLVIMVVASASAGNGELETEILTVLDPHESIIRIDSLQSVGVLTERETLALKARTYNRPGFWSMGGTQTAALFDAALTAFDSDPVLSRRDSVAYYTLLLEYAYFNARADRDAPVGQRSLYAAAEEDCLERVLHKAPCDWQCARAAFELGRYHRFRSSPYTRNRGNEYQAALEHLQFVLERYGESDFVLSTLWNLTGLHAEHSNFEAAFSALEQLEHQAKGSKWEERARRLRSTISRREISVDLVTSDGQRLMVGGQARNIEGELILELDRAREMGFERTGRLPFAGDDAAWSTVENNNIAVEAGRGGEGWHTAMAIPEAGFYRLRATLGDTTVAYTIGVWDMEVLVVSSGPTLAIRPARNSRVVVSIEEGDSSWRILTVRDAQAGELVTCDLRGRRPFQFYLTDGTGFGWSGPNLWAPCFQVWPNGQDRPAGHEQGTK